MSGIDMALEGAVDGPECETVFFADRQDFLGKLDAAVTSLLARDVPLHEMIILSTRRRENSLLAGRDAVGGQPIIELATDDGSGRGIHFCTMQGFKGLERNVVLAVDMQGIGEEGWSMLHYAGLSRARGLLTTFVHESDRGRFDAQAKDFGRRMVRGADQ
jgi:hypothetical protein